MATSVLTLIVLCLALVERVWSFAYFLEKQCDLSISGGVVMMGNALVESADKRLSLTRNGVEVKDNVIASLDGLMVALVPKSTQSILELRTDGVIFKSGSCKGKRIVQKGTLELETAVEASAPLEITIVAAWAMSYSSGVKYTAPFTFLYQPSPTEKSTEL